MANETKIVITAATAQAEAALGKFGNTVGAVSKKMFDLSGVAGTLAGALSVTAFANIIKQSIDAADRLDELSQVTGTSVEALAGLDYAATQNGASLETVARGGQKLAAMLADKPALFKKFGISATDSTEAMIQLADVFASMPDGIEKSALATKLFGDKLGNEMVLFLNQGTDALRDNIAAGQEYNPVTKESARMAAEFNDNLDKLRASAGQAGMAMTNELLPQLTQISEAMAIAARQGGLLESIWVGLGGLGTALFTDDMLERSAQIEKELEKLRKWETSLTPEAVIARAINPWKIEDVRVQIALLENELQKLDKLAAKDAGKPAAVGTAATGKGKALLDTLGGGTKKTSSFDPDGDFWAKVDDASEKNRLKARADAEREFAQAAKEANNILSNVDPIAKANAEWQKLLDLQQTLGDEFPLTAEQMGQAYQKAVGDMGDSTDQMTLFAQRAGENIQDIFAEFLFDPFKGGLDGMLADFSKMLQRMAAEALASQILGSIGDWGKTGGGAGTSLGGVAAAVFGGKSFDGGGFTGFGSRSGGLDGKGGFLAMMHPKETVIDHTKPNNNAGGGAITVVNHFTLNQPADRRTQEQIASMAGASIRAAQMRGS